MSHIATLNLESSYPTVDTAIQKLKNSLSTYKMQGVKAVIVIHGYGSSGVGGGIKNAVKSTLNENSMRGIVRAYAGGEQWTSKKKEMIGMCGSLKDYDSRIAGNQGITVVLLR